MNAGALGAAVAVAGALLVAGCGNDGKSVEDKAFGGLSAADEANFRKVSRTIGKASIPQAQVLRALREQRGPAARPALDRLNVIVSEAGAQTRDFEGNGVRRILQDYLAPIRRYGVALGRVVSLLEKERTTGVPASEATAKALAQDLQAASEQVDRNERRFENRVLKVMSPGQRRRYRAQVRRLQERLKQQSAPVR